MTPSAVKLAAEKIAEYAALYGDKAKADIAALITASLSTPDAAHFQAAWIVAEGWIAAAAAELTDNICDTLRESLGASAAKTDRVALKEAVAEVIARHASPAAPVLDAAKVDEACRLYSATNLIYDGVEPWWKDDTKHMHRDELREKDRTRMRAFLASLSRKDDR